MDKEQAKRFGALIRARRHELGLSTYDVGNEIGSTNSTIIRIEQGAFAAPRPDKLARIAEVLHLSLADVFAEAGYVVPDELPSFRTYLVTRYRDLPETAVDELVAHFDSLNAAPNIDQRAVTHEDQGDFDVAPTLTALRPGGALA
jgi:transcriptional regulator with XRE-family HTH domain